MPNAPCLDHYDIQLLQELITCRNHMQHCPKFSQQKPEYHLEYAWMTTSCCAWKSFERSRAPLTATKIQTGPNERGSLYYSLLECKTSSSLMLRLPITRMTFVVYSIDLPTIRMHKRPDKQHHKFGHSNKFDSKGLIVNQTLSNHSFLGQQI